ncbi:DUF1287 domain-containing protein [Haliangium sp.]|uniref:DUF1287 domain-containing protein n=1 Tax=Haliangium sp. TaxID=2663208 RepID=UPI003D0F5388
MADPTHGVLVLYADGWPVKVYPLTDAAPGADGLALRPRDRAELAPLRARAHLRTLPPKAAPPPGDRDRDGIPDPLDVLIGAKKTALNRAQYGAGYQKLDYPMGDVPRDQGVCTDVIVRAVRNAGLDIQVEIQRDIRRAPAAYPMVSRPNRHIDHRRVRTLLPYFQRRWDRRSVTLNDPDDPLRPGDVLFFDTLPDRSGPDHVGIASDRVTADGLPLVINNWSDGSVTAEMDLLAWVPVTHRFRIPPARRSRR